MYFFGVLGFEVQLAAYFSPPASKSAFELLDPTDGQLSSQERFIKTRPLKVTVGEMWKILVSLMAF